MKNSKDDNFNAERYNTFSETLSSFYQRGGTDIDLITNVLHTPYDFLDCMYDHMRNNPSAYKDNVDSFGFSALYYWKLRPIELSKKSALEKLGFKELYPNTYKIYHLKNHSYYSHNIDRAEIVFVFLGDDDKGVLDTDTVHKLFMSGFNVISVDARKENIMLSDVFNVVYRYSTKDIKLFFIGSPGILINNMHAISILGHNEEITQPIDSIWKLLQYLDDRLPSKYIVDHINTASFIKGLSYAASGYSAEMSIFLIQAMPWIFFPAGKKMNVLLASAHGQTAASHAKYALPEGSEILILGEDHYIKDNQYIVHLNQQNIIDIFDYIMNNKIQDISITNLTKIYLISAQDLYAASPYYMKVISHKLWGEPITKEFSCITALHQKTEEMITMREEKDHNYIKLLAIACENGFNQPEPVLEEMWTIEYIKTTTTYHFIKMVEKDVVEAREVVYSNIWHYCSYFYTTLHDYILGHDIH